MFVDSFDVVFYTCTFLLPGFIINSVVNSLVPKTRLDDVRYPLSCLLYSIINCALCSWFYVALTKNISSRNPVLYWFLMVIGTIIVALIVAFVIGFTQQKGVIEHIFSRVGINKVHPIPTAWDYYFSKQQASWIVVTLRSGKVIYGLYAQQSFASSNPSERDLYIEKTYTLDDDMTWIEDSKSNGILISKDEIEAIEFFK